MCKYAVKKLPYLLRYVPNKCNIQWMCDKTIPKNSGTLNYVLECYKKSRNV